MRSLSLALCLFAVGASHAQDVIFLGKPGTVEYQVSAGRNAQKVGRGVMVWVHSLFAGGTAYSEKVLVACKGDWIIPSLDLNFELGSEDARPNAAVLLTKARAKEGRPFSASEIAPLEESPEEYASLLRQNLKQLCTNPAPEPKNIEIPLVLSSFDKSEMANLMSLVSGTFQRRAGSGEIGDFWLKAVRIKRSEVMVDGKPWMVEGKVQKKNERVGSHDMQQMAVNCRLSQLATWRSVSYDEKGQTDDGKSWELTRETVRLQDTVPNSVGEQIVKSVCAIYNEGTLR